MRTARHRLSVLRRDSPTTWWMVKIACPREGHERFCLLYRYFRHADDIIDAPGRDPAFVLGFVDRQDALIAGTATPEGPEEQTLVSLLADPLAVPIVTGMWEALRFDAERGPEPLPDAVLAEQIARIGDSYTHALWCCAGERGELPEDVLWLARAATAAHMMRDCEEDLGLGYCNIPTSVMQQLGRSPSELTASDIAEWRRQRTAEINPWFDRGIAALPALGFGRGRWLLRAFAAKYQRLCHSFT